MRGKVYVGTSGWHYKHWRSVFYPIDLPASEMLRFYARHFDTVELNNSFYHLPTPATFDAWRDNSPDKFVFAVKGSRFITHMKKLKDPESSTEKFFLNAGRLERKLGPILFQLPPRWNVNVERLANFLDALPAGHQYVVEFRDESWLVPQVYDLLQRHNTAFCIHDLGGRQTPLELTAGFTYIRFHGPTAAKYSGSYSLRALENWADTISLWRNSGRTVYVYFNNDAGGAAIENASTLKTQLKA
ncbi:MAG TPA: DUF72 domain-containing protein [Pyrinomonadaceae bacterium]|jgi:uncharacterized protein YecE (DUF72 family)|nr:DUF72 domain-containing protein [Pyrinomonadaceae bacterium]